jgi:uncharacterized lipoprotein YddW (UPF0748 family)
MIAVGDLIVMVGIAVAAFAAGFAARGYVVWVYVVRDETLDSLWDKLQAADARREATQWEQDGFLADVITEVYRQLKQEKIQQQVKEERHGTSAAKDRP